MSVRDFFFNGTYSRALLFFWTLFCVIGTTVLVYDFLLTFAVSAVWVVTGERVTVGIFGK